MISREIRAARSRNVTEALSIDEEMTPLLPRNIYGVTKFAAEHLCRLFHQIHGLPVIILRTARFFPEEDDMAHEISQSGPNTKANELLFRRLSVEDAAESHVVAISKAPEIGFDTFIISARTPFQRGDCRQLITDAPAVVERYFPHYRGLYERVGWTMFQRIDRVYDSRKASRILSFECRYGFKEMLDELAAKTGSR
jgi:UDP-glucose 4-epimerase